MAIENFANDYTTALNGGITSGATSLVVVSATGVPSVPFRIKVAGEIMLVTAVASQTFTVTRGQEGTAAAAHVDGDPVEHILTAAQLAAFQTAIGVSVTHSTTQSIGTSISTAVTFNTEVEDLHGFYSGGAPTQLTVPVGYDGVYDLFAQLSYAASAVGTRYLILYKNGVPFIQAQGPAGSTDRTHILLACPIRLVGGDYVQVYARHDVGSSINIGHTSAELKNKLSLWRR